MQFKNTEIKIGSDEVIYRCDQVKFTLNSMTETVQIYPVVIFNTTSIIFIKKKSVHTKIIQIVVEGVFTGNKHMFRGKKRRCGRMRKTAYIS